ncbi:MAG: hypothetical protein P9L95_00285 [Candidatus Tenebribacter mawsonii]|nr:hypothetical protein [Candidatus Tenebribacter mawsonii]
MKKGLILITMLIVCTSIFANEFKLIESPNLQLISMQRGIQ